MVSFIRVVDFENRSILLYSINNVNYYSYFFCV